MAIKLKGTGVQGGYALDTLQAQSQGLVGLTSNASAKRFAYVDKGSHLNETKAAAFADSLIVVGDEERAWIPSLNTYVGPKKGDIEALQAATSTGVVTTLNGMTRDNYIVSNPLSEYIHNDMPTKITGAELHTTYNSIINGQKGVAKLTNGIQVSTYITYYTTYTEGTGYGGLTTTKNNDELNKAKQWLDQDEHKGYFVGSYTVIDDSKTLSNIATLTSDVISYSAAFTKAWTDQEVNRLYSEILGISYIPKNFNDADGITNQFVSGTYVKLGSGYKVTNVGNTQLMFTTDSVFATAPNTATDNTKLNSGQTIKVNVSHATVAQNSSTALDWTQDNEISLDLPTTITGNKITLTIPAGTLSNSGVTVPAGGITIEVPVDTQLWTQTNNNTSNLSNVTGAITTLNQVASILDKITDGKSDDGISLAYSIADNRLDIDVLTYQMAQLTDYEGKKGDPEIKNVNSVKAVSNTGDFVTISAKGTYPSEGTADSTNVKHGNVEMSVSYTNGTINKTSGSAPSTSNPTGTAPTFTKNKDGLLTTYNVSDFSAYVNNTTTYILGVVDAKDNALAGSLIEKHTDSSTNNDLELFSNITYANGKYTIGTKHLQIVSGSNNYSTTPNNNASEISITKSGDNYVLNNVTYTLSLSSSDITSPNAKNLAIAQDVHSYIMNLITWVDLSDDGK